MGDEQLWSSADSDLSKFQPSPPYGDECDIIEFNKTIFTISTHTPHGDEQKAWVVNLKICTLQPTPPHGDERNNLIKNQLYRIFNSHPVRDEPIGLQLALDMYYFNPHPHMGDERHTINWKETIIYFNPHLPHGGWTDSWYLQTNHMITFQPTPPYGDEQITGG